MTQDDKTVVTEVNFAAGDRPAPPPGYEDLGGAYVTPKFRQFVQAAMEGKLPDLPPIPEQDPRVQALAEELMVIHLPEWKNPAGRKLAEPSVTHVPNAVRVAEYLLQRGITFDPDKAVIQWIPTPGANLGTGDPGAHIYRLPDGTWPADPDIEKLWSVDDIKCHQLPDGRWSAVHPRGIECTDASRTEAFAMCVERVRAKIVELKGV
jgi:hypothetical protein